MSNTEIAIHIGKRYKFNYPIEFTTLPEYSAHRGMVGTVTGRIPEHTTDEVEYYITFDDGFVAEAFISELELVGG